MFCAKQKPHFENIKKEGKLILTTRNIKLYSFFSFYFIGENFGLYECDLCALSFESETERNEHTKSHFKRVICGKCDKTLIQIANEWYELHVEANCHNKENHLKPQTNQERKSTELDMNYATEKVPFNKYECFSNVDVAESNFTLELESDVGSVYASDGSVIDMDNHHQTSIKLEIRPLEDNSTATVENAELPGEPAEATNCSDNINHTGLLSTSEQIRAYFGQKKEIDTNKTKSNKTVKKSSEDWSCTTCNKKLKSRSSLNSHIRTVHEKKYSKSQKERAVCDICKQTFSTFGNMRKHRESHIEVNRFVCSFCGRGFNGLFNLKEHINMHTGAQPYTCEVCGKKFGRQTNKYSHMRIHTGEKPYKCNFEDCERAYTFKIDLNRHKYSVHGIYTKKHICQICSKVYSENKLLKKHLLSHNNSNKVGSSLK